MINTGPTEHDHDTSDLSGEAGPTPLDPISSTTTEPPEADATETSANREAARYRRALRQAEGERDDLAARVERFQRAEVDRLAGAHLAQPGDLFDVGQVTLADLLDDDGNVEPALVDGAVLGLLTSRPGLGRGMVRPGPAAGFGQGDFSAVVPGGASWSGLLRKG